MKAIEFIEFCALAAVLLFGFALAYNGLFVKEDYFLPTYDNAMLHAGRARVIIDTGHWAEMELVFGGVTKSYHVPAYPTLVADVALLSGLNWLWAVRVVALLFSILLPLSFYLLAKKLTGGNWFAGAAAAFFALCATSLTTWGMRTSPISLGVILVPLGLYFVVSREWIPALGVSLVIALTHQPSLLTLFLTLSVFFALELFTKFASSRELAQKIFLEKSLRNAYSRFSEAIDLLPFAAAVSAFLLYIVWHVRQTGLSCLNFKCLPQLGAREYGGLVDLPAYFTKFPAGGAALFGAIWIYFDKRMGVREKLLLFSWLFACLLLVRNDLLGLGVFTERFVTYLDEVTAVFAGVFVGSAFAFLVERLQRMLEAKPAHTVA